MRERDSLIPESLMVQVAERLRLLGQPSRLRLVELLMDGPSTPQALSDALGLSQQNVSKHLLSLHRVGILSRREAGAHVVYALIDHSAAAILRLAYESATHHLEELASSAVVNRDSDREAREDRDPTPTDGPLVVSGGLRSPQVTLQVSDGAGREAP